MKGLEGLARLIAEGEGVNYDREGPDGFTDRRALMQRAKELEDVQPAEAAALIRWHGLPTAEEAGKAALERGRAAILDAAARLKESHQYVDARGARYAAQVLGELKA